jgi:hypothetical protein
MSEDAATIRKQRAAILTRVRDGTREMASLIAAMDRQWWRLLHNRKRKARVRELRREGGRLLNSLVPFKTMQGRQHENGLYTFCDFTGPGRHGEGCVCAAAPLVCTAPELRMLDSMYGPAFPPERGADYIVPPPGPSFFAPGEIRPPGEPVTITGTFCPECEREGEGFIARPHTHGEDGSPS